jgi:hypothetical protein
MHLGFTLDEVGLMFAGQRHARMDQVAEDDPIVDMIPLVIADLVDWEGTATDMLTALAKIGNRIEFQPVVLPAPNRLKHRLAPLESIVLERHGLQIHQMPRTRDQRRWRITRVDRHDRHIVTASMPPDNSVTMPVTMPALESSRDLPASLLANPGHIRPIAIAAPPGDDRDDASVFELPWLPGEIGELV